MTADASLPPAGRTDEDRRVVAPQLPEGLLWGLFTENATGRLRLVDRDGGVFCFDSGEVPHVAAALAEHCDDNDVRTFVAGEWGERW